MSDWQWQYVAGAVLLVVVAYGMSRAASIGYFRTKLEYWRSITREARRNGEE